MRWYRKLYIGENAKENRFSIMRNIWRNKKQSNVFVITPASNGNNILDIYPSMVLLQSYYKKQDLLILGIAYGKEESITIAGEIVKDLYEKTGGFSLSDFIEQPPCKE